MSKIFTIRPKLGEYDVFHCYSVTVSEKACEGTHQMMPCLNEVGDENPYEDSSKYTFLGEYVDKVSCTDSTHNQFVKYEVHYLYYKLVGGGLPDLEPEEPKPIEHDPRGTQPPLVKKYFFKKQKNTNQASIDLGGQPAFRWIPVPEKDGTCNPCDITWNTPTGDISLKFGNSTTSDVVPFTVKSPSPFVPQNAYFTDLPDWITSYNITSTGVTFTVIPSRLSSSSAVFERGLSE